MPSYTVLCSTVSKDNSHENIEDEGETVTLRLEDQVTRWLLFKKSEIRNCKRGGYTSTSLALIHAIEIYTTVADSPIY